MLDPLFFDLRLRIFDTLEQTHALTEFFLHSVALLLVRLGLLLQLLQTLFKVTLFTLKSTFALLPRFSLTRELFDQLTDFGLVFLAQIGQADFLV